MGYLVEGGARRDEMAMEEPRCPNAAGWSTMVDEWGEGDRKFEFPRMPGSERVRTD